MRLLKKKKKKKKKKKDPKLLSGSTNEILCNIQNKFSDKYLLVCATGFQSLRTLVIILIAFF